MNWYYKLWIDWLVFYQKNNILNEKGLTFPFMAMCFFLSFYFQILLTIIKYFTDFNISVLVHLDNEFWNFIIYGLLTILPIVIINYYLIYKRFTYLNKIVKYSNGKLVKKILLPIVVVTFVLLVILYILNVLKDFL